MAKIDGYRYPTRDPEESVEISKVIVNQHGGEVSSKQKFAEDIGHNSPKSGAYNQKIADARKFGILPSRGLEATELAYELANPKSPAEERESLFKMYRNVPILDLIYNHLEGRVPESDFWRILTEVTDTNPKEAREASDDLRPLYEEMLTYEPQEESASDAGANGDNSTSSGNGDSSDSLTTIPTAETIQASSDGVYLKIGEDSVNLGEVNEMNLGIAKFVIDQKISELSSADSASEPTDKGEPDDPEDGGLGDYLND